MLPVGVVTTINGRRLRLFDRGDSHVCPHALSSMVHHSFAIVRNNHGPAIRDPRHPQARRLPDGGDRCRGDWAIRFGNRPGTIKCHAVTAGACWLAVDGTDAPTWLIPELPRFFTRFYLNTWAPLMHFSRLIAQVR